MEKSRVPKLENWGFPIQEKSGLETQMVEFVKARRIQPNPREQFLIITRLFAIFGHAILWGLKTPVIRSLFYRFNEEDKYV